MRRVEVNVHHYFHSSPDQQSEFDHILRHLHDLGVKMSALSDAVDAVLASEADEDARTAALLAAKDAVIADLQSQIDSISSQLTTALANDAADAQTIADTQAQLVAQAADVQAQIDRLAEAFPPAPVENNNEG